ncbi:MAG: phytase, partial [Pseudomonadota bacterium]
MVTRVARAAVVLLLVLGVSFGALVALLEHPSTKGPTRCWLQESLYGQSWEDAPAGTPVVEAMGVTEAVRDMCDAADDPAILVSEAGAFVLGTNKQRSLNIYDLDGTLVARADDLGAPNNVDLRLLLGRAIAAASDKDGAEIEVFTIDQATGEPTVIEGAPFSARAEDEIYGICLYKADEALFVFTTDKSGLIVQYELKETDKSASLTEMRALRVDS